MSRGIPAQRNSEELFNFAEQDTLSLVANLKDLSEYACDQAFNSELRTEARRACMHLLFELDCRLPVETAVPLAA